MKEQLNAPKKDYCEPMHTAEHILNQTMIRMFNCGRSKNAHIEAKKSKCDYALVCEPTASQLEEIARRVNEVIAQNLDVTERILEREEAAKVADLSKLPPDASQKTRLIFVGDYDACACIGAHVKNTAEIGEFSIISSDYENCRLRLRWKVSPAG